MINQLTRPNVTKVKKVKDKQQLTKVKGDQKLKLLSLSKMTRRRVFLDKCPEANCREKPWKSPGSNLRHRIT